MSGGTRGHREQTGIRDNMRTDGKAVGKRDMGQRKGKGEKAKGGWIWCKKNQEKKEEKKTCRRLM